MRAQLSFFKAKGLKVAQLALPTAPKGILDTLGADDDDGLPGRGIGDADLPSSDEEDEDFEARISRTIIPYYSPVRLSLMIASAAGCACAAQGGGAGSDGGSPSDSSSESEEEALPAKPEKKAPPPPPSDALLGLKSRSEFLSEQERRLKERRCCSLPDAPVSTCLRISRIVV